MPFVTLKNAYLIEEFHKFESGKSGVEAGQTFLRHCLGSMALESLAASRAVFQYLIQWRQQREGRNIHSGTKQENGVIFQAI